MSNAVELVIEGGRRSSLVQGVRELWISREVIWAFAERNVRLKYKQAALGVAWVVLQPLAFLTIFTIIFGRMVHLSAGHTSYPAFALSALVPWLFLQTAVAFGAQSLIQEGALVRKIYFAREAPVLGTVLGSGLDFAIGLALLFILGPMLGTRLSWAVVFILPLMAVLSMLATGVAMMLAALYVYYRDFRYALPLLLQIWMFASPVVYPLSHVPSHLRDVYIVANPAAGILDGFSRTLAEGRPPDLGLLAVSASVSLLIAWGGYRLFKYMEPGFADVI